MRRRGFFSALPFVGIMLGTLLASAVFVGLGQVPEDALLGWVWRVPFLASIFLIAVAVLIRLRLKETPPSSSSRSRNRSARSRSASCCRRRARPCSAASACGWRERRLVHLSNADDHLREHAGRQKSIGPLAVAIGATIGFFTIPFAGSCRTISAG